jgi:phage portal protein BeeE
MSIVSELFYNKRHKSIPFATARPSEHNIIQLGNDLFYSLTNDNIFKAGNPVKDFYEVPELNAVLNIRAKAMASWKLEVLSDITGKPAAGYEHLIKIIRRPNWYQSQVEFWRQSSLFRDLFGNEVLYFLRPVGMPKSFQGLFTLDSSKIKIEYDSKELPFMQGSGDTVRYYYIHNQKKIELEKADIIHLNDNRVNGTTENFLMGESKLRALAPAIANIRAAYKKRGIILRMPVGILANNQTDAIGQATPLDATEKETAQQELRGHGALPILTSLNIKYNAMNVNASSMGLFEECIEDTGRICDAFGVPYKLLSSAKAGTLNNSGGDVKEARKQMYEETIIPDAAEKVEALNDFVGSAGKSWSIAYDFNHLPVFDEDKKNRADSLKTTVDALNVAMQAGVITADQFKLELTKFGI